MPRADYPIFSGEAGVSCPWAEAFAGGGMQIALADGSRRLRLRVKRENRSTFTPRQLVILGADDRLRPMWNYSPARGRVE